MMHLTSHISPMLPALALGLSACQPVPCAGGACGNGADLPEAEYLGVETRLLDGDLVNFRVRMAGLATEADVQAYAECAAAQYALIRGFGFARHVRTQVNENKGMWHGDAVYTISPALPGGLKTIDAEVTVANCHENGIPTV